MPPCHPGNVKTVEDPAENNCETAFPVASEPASHGRGGRKQMTMSFRVRGTAGVVTSPAAHAAHFASRHGGAMLHDGR
jgi:hypothetical protein